MYTTNRGTITEKLIFWLPLARVVQFLPSNQGADLDHVNALETGIVKYLNNLGIEISAEEFLLLPEQRKIVLLFDGLDEVIKVVPWLPASIVKLTRQFNENLQIIITSRMSGSYLNEIPFFALTLLPFTDNQRNEFIAKWFENEPNQSIQERITRHLLDNIGISDIIRNPLLTTTLCVLAKHGLPLPRTEITLYEERIKLLTGYYDSVKNITARISVTPQVLEILAQKTAFYLHSETKREEHLHILIGHVKKLMINEMTPETVEMAIKELFDPCNLMVPMSEDGKFGFGHLRYQEHLAAREIINNRSIDIRSFLKQPWWAGVLVLFARMNSIEWLVQELGKEGKLALYEGVIKDMIKARPKQERSSLNSLMDRYLSLDLDLDINDDFDDDY
jgi:predicted NACHT family NTPase